MAGYGSGNILSSTTAVATTLKAIGKLITGQVDYISLPSASHTLIGNPYASPLYIATMLELMLALVVMFGFVMLT